MTSVERVAAYVAEKEAIAKLLRDEGPRAIKAACKSISLRELARRTELSPTYLSQIGKGIISISADSFLKVASYVRN